ncbi:hypothetical protein EV182_002083 [Spiromyces aspiralis]|uniref:Uncharacterized protein n=1 Tax=Spiromyces aspiralis TaxID=68401 RepID=A0ACC1HS88_9FUNG|nr:hypothetical protein EV182_002083 [Spiromyces aspiralis]
MAEYNQIDTAYNVGAVIVKDGKVVSEGYSRELEGNTHAEQCALEKLIRRGEAAVAENAAIYTTMEPCSVRLSGNKPCTDRLIESGIRTVYLGVLEPLNFVQCQGRQLLEQNGIRVIHIKELEKECMELNSHLVNKQAH